MSSNKRKLLNMGLQRRVRARLEPEPESDVEETSSEAPSEATSEADVDDFGSGDNIDERASNGSDDGEADSELEEDAGPSRIYHSKLSFGALARGRAALPSPREKRSQKGASSGGDTPGSDRDESPAKKLLSAAEQRERLKRTSKHAPVEVSSKRRVSRKRDFIEVPKVQARDPRFMPLGRGASGAAPSKVEEIVARKAYAFLDDYRQDELDQLRAAAKKEKDPAAKETLQKAVISAESRLKAQKRKDRERELLEEHRKKEKQLVKQGKKPFYLKKAEQKKKLLLDQYANMKKGQVDKAIERRRKKMAAKEKKALPLARRTAEDR